MARDNKYGQIEIKGLPADEPVFVLRAQDALALPAILQYLHNVQSLGRVDDPMVPLLRSTIAQFGNFKGNRKLPD